MLFYGDDEDVEQNHFAAQSDDNILANEEQFLFQVFLSVIFKLFL